MSSSLLNIGASGLRTAGIHLQVIGSNIANVNTPAYQALMVEPHQVTSLQQDVSASTYSIKPNPELKSRIDGNNVNIDLELGQVRKASLKQRALTQLLSTKVRQMRLAMTGN